MKKNIFHTVTLLLLSLLLLFYGCEKNDTVAPDNGKSDTDSDTGAENNGAPAEGDGNESAEDNTDTENDTDSNEPVYPPSDPSDPYENDKHWDLP